jgi:hypothetical protein
MNLHAVRYAIGSRDKGGQMLCTNCGKPKEEHYFCSGYTHGHCHTAEGSWGRTMYEEPRPTVPYAQRLALAEKKLAEFAIEWDGEKYAFGGGEK